VAEIEPTYPRGDGPSMITAGVDLSSQTAHTASCVIEWSSSQATVGELALDVDDQAVSRLARTVDKLGIDVPLGWPVAFADAVARHSRHGLWPEEYDHSDTSPYRYRRTDLWVWKTLQGSPPLSVSTDLIALPAMRAAALLSRLPQRVMLDGSGVVVEAYPAAALRRWGFAWRGYKRKEQAGTRRTLVEGFFRETQAWLAVDHAALDHCLLSHDAFDALIAALVARAAAVGLVDLIPEAEKLAALKEGWIAVPREGSLGLLPLG
jgi:predicted nuclease with RNAse H fold